VAAASDERTAAEVSGLRHDEGVRLDPDRLGALYAELGHASAESVVCRAMEELAVRITDMQRFLATGEHDALYRSGRLLAKVADQIGMTSLARVATDVCLCAERGDGAALGATMARLVRIGDRSLTAVWDLQDLSV